MNWAAARDAVVLLRFLILKRQRVRRGGGVLDLRGGRLRCGGGGKEGLDAADGGGGAGNGWDGAVAGGGAGAGAEEGVNWGVDKRDL